MNYKAKLSWLICISWLTLMTSVAHSAGSNVNGVINGTVVDSDGAAIGGVTVTATNPSNGLSRSVTSDDDGSYSVNVPTGIYNVSSEKAGTTSGRVNDVAVTLGAASTVKLVVGTRGESLEEVIVLGTAISTNTDVASTGLNISIEDIELLPVGRNIESVALLAPGTVSGDSAFGEEKNLVSFGGSSVAENVYYIDGLNVTNFRNGLGGSTVPFEFYQDLLSAEPMIGNMAWCLTSNQTACEAARLILFLRMVVCTITMWVISQIPLLLMRMLADH